MSVSRMNGFAKYLCVRYVSGFLIFEIYRDDDCEKFSALIGKGS